MEKNAEAKNQKCQRVARVLLMTSMLALAAGFVLLVFSVAAGTAAAAAGFLLGASGFILLKKPEYIALIGW